MKNSNAMNFRHWTVSCTLSFAGCLGITTYAVAEVDKEQSLQDALKQITSQCPEKYPDRVVPLGDDHELAKMKTDQLMEMLHSWNPAVRRNAATELGKRGDSVDADLRKGTRSDNWMVRAGVTNALSAILKQKLSKWKEAYPEMTNYRQAQQKIRENSKLSEVFVRMAKDVRPEVRKEGLQGLSLLALPTPDAIQAIFNLCTDDDAYMAQDAMMVLQKQFSDGAIKQDGVVEVLKQAMRSPLPRGRGSVVILITKMKEKDQRKFIPELLAHLDWIPNRDTMFGAGGQADSIKILTKVEVKELIPRLPKLMTKSVRGTSLVDPCLDAIIAFGKDAKVIVPQLREMIVILKPTERDLKGSRGEENKKRYDKLVETFLKLEKM